MPLYALIGNPLSHSFSKTYFTKKFKRDGIKDSHYELFPLDAIEAFPGLIESWPELKGMNVTIPYKETVMDFLDDIDPDAAEVGAVNTILFRNSKTKGFNTDVYGFRKSLEGLFRASGKAVPAKALVLGTGGASKAVGYVLKQLAIPFQLVSRQAGKGHLTYGELTEKVMQTHHLIVNTTPLGMHPKSETCPDVPYEYLEAKHFLYDLVYNPEKTLFLERGEQAGASICNGLEMLHLQAEKAWDIWTSET
ncbi:MAG: shikimate dehydrogenase [Bacteroidota bacterium]